MVDVELRGGVADKTCQHVVKLVAPAFSGSFRPGHADQRELLRQHLGAQQIVERRHHQALGQVAGSAEDHHGARVGRFGLAPRRARNQLRCLRRPDLKVVKHGATRRRVGAAE